MDTGALLRVLLLWTHALAAVAWVGGSIFYALVVRPVLEDVQQSAKQRMALRFRGLVDVCAFALVITGAVITFDRLSRPGLGVAYVVVLGLKIALAVWMFALARDLALRRRASSRPRGIAAGNLVLTLGVLIFLLAEVLRLLYEGSAPSL